MKEIKVIVIAVVITVAMMLATACAMPAQAEAVQAEAGQAKAVQAEAEQAEAYGEFYPRLSVVVEVHTDTVICQDKEGNLWAFFSDEEDWAVGDICNLLMWNLSKDITQHEIVEVYWEGYTDNLELFFQVMGWR